MPINLKLAPEDLKKLFPEAKEGDSFETSVEGTFKMENGELVPYVESVDGQPLSAAPMAEGSEDVIAEALDEKKEMEMPMEGAMGKPSMPSKDTAKAALVSGLSKLQEGKPKEKYM